MRFDPYSEWLDVPPGPRPPDPYALLGVPRFERDTERITAAAEARARTVRHQASFDRVPESQRLLREIRSANELLNDPERRRHLEMTLRRADKRTPQHNDDAAQRDRTLPPPETAQRRTLALAGALAAVILLGVGAAGLLWRSASTPATGSADPVVAGAAPSQQPEPQSPSDAHPEGKQPAANAGSKPVKTASADEPVPSSDSTVEEPVRVPEPIRERALRSPVVASRPSDESGVPGSAARPVPQQLPPVEAPRPVERSLAGYRAPSFNSAEEAATFVNHLRQLLDEGLAMPGGDLDAALRHHRSASAMSPDNSLADYAMALVDWKRLRFDEARARLEAARGTPDQPFLSAWRALIPLHLKLNQRDLAIKEAVAFAGVLGRFDGDTEQIRARDESLRWLGRLTAVLEAPWNTDALPPQDAVDADAAIREVLDASRLKVYEQGRRSLRDDVAVRREEAEVAIGELSVAHDLRQSEQLTAIADERSVAKDQQATMARTSGEWEKKLADQTTEIDAQLERLIPQFRRFSVEAEAAWTTLAFINDQILTQLNSQQSDQSPSGVFLTSPSLLASQEQALTRYRLAAERANGVRRQADQLVARRRTVVLAYEKATQKLVAESDTLKKWDDVLRRRAKKTESVDADSLPAVRRLRRRLQDIHTYVMFDLESERNAVESVLDDLDSGRSPEPVSP